ncbi:MAG TPA: ATP-binding protein [Candidatus Paceibacterota bacterium]|nr:ATP-binding protein [Candidatus Paceibacterota bacterium]
MQTAESSKIDFHHGQALLRVAGHYPTLAEVVYEAVQNALDADATNINVAINHKKRTLTVSDDGVGTTRSRFEDALLSVCKGIKDGDKLGQFGMGLIAPLGKCQRFTFISTPKSNPRAYLQWTFSTDDICGQEKIDGIPVEPLPDLHFEREGSRSGVAWRTQVKLYNFTKDRLLSRMTASSLREGILERFSTAMRRRGVTVNVEIVSSDGEVSAEKIVADVYEGKRLPMEYIREKDAGQTTFQLYIAKKTQKGRRGKVVIGESGKDFTISFAQFASHAGELLDSDVCDALESGVFEGQIFTEKAKLDPNRRHFIANDALMGLCIAIDEWYRKIGASHIAKVKEEAQDDRYQQLGMRSMRVVEGLLEQPAFAYLKDVVKSFRIGTIGTRHTRPDAKIIGTQSEPSISIDAAKSNGNGGGGNGGGGSDPKSEHPGHTPYTVSGPKGRQRMMVRGNSQGLQFLYEEMEGSDRLWDLDSNAGVLRYNTRHPLWAECESDERALMRFQEHIAITALTLETVPKEWKEQHRRMTDDAMPSIAFWLLKGDELAGRRAGRPKGSASAK